VEFLARVKATTLACLEHQEYPYEELVHQLRLERDAGRNPLFEVVLAFQNFEQRTLSMPGLHLKHYSARGKRTKFDLYLQVHEQDQRLHFALEYASRLWSPQTAARLLAYLERLLEGVLARPQAPLAELELLSPSERQQLLEGFNQTYLDYPRHQTIVDLFEQQAERTPHAVALVFRDQQLTYQELNQQANRLAHALLAKGVATNDLVCILMNNSDDAVISILGTLKAGAAYMPIDPGLPLQRIQSILEESKPKIGITTSRYRTEIVDHLPSGPGATAAEPGLAFIGLEELAGKVPELPRGHIPVPIRGGDRAYIIYTSGSTGKPKGVVVSHKGLYNLTRYQIGMFQLNEEGSVLQFASVGFDASVSEICTTLGSGATLFVYDRDGGFSTEDLHRVLKEQKITVVTLPPSILRILPVEKLDHLKTVVSAGEACDGEVAEKWRIGRRFINGYGPTEYTVCTAMHLVEEKVAAKVPIGKPIDNTRVLILGPDNELRPVKVPGELCVSGDGIAIGYLNDADLTGKKFTENPFFPGQKMYRTGDLAQWLPDGTLEYLGRLDDQVKIRGLRIELAEIEHHLSRHTQIREAVVLCREKKEEKYLVAYYAAEEEMGAGALRNFLGERLPSYMVPAFYVRVESIPLTHNGKVDRKALPEPDLQDQEYRPATNPTEAELVEIWSEILSVDKDELSVNKSFFELGGHSLIAPVLVKRISARLHVACSLETLFRLQTISALAEYVQFHATARQLDEVANV
jgi:amino acid adenylation domain-containing protein